MRKELFCGLSELRAAFRSRFPIPSVSIFAIFIAAILLSIAGCSQDTPVNILPPAAPSDTARGGVGDESIEVVSSGAPTENDSSEVNSANSDDSGNDEPTASEEVTTDEIPTASADVSIDSVPVASQEVPVAEVPATNQEIPIEEVLAANPDAVTVVAGNSVTIKILDNDNIAAGNTNVTIDTSVSPQVTHGWLSVDQAAGTITYNPYGAIQPDADQFAYRLAAGGRRSNVTTVTVTIAPRPPPAGCEYAGSANKRFSLLLIGNSLMNEIEAKLKKLLVCKGYTTDIETNNPGGSTLHQHNNHPRTTSLIAKGYDLTLIQEQSKGITAHNSPPYEVISQLKAKIEAAGSRIGFYQTWGRQNRDPVETESILSGYEDVADFFAAPIVRIGRAWDLFYTSNNESPPFSLYVDYAHPTQHGKALIAYVLYAYLTGDSPVGLPSLKLDQDDALLLQLVAWESHTTL